MLKLSLLLVLFAFSPYPSTEGSDIDYRENVADPSIMFDDLEAYEHCFYGSTVVNTMESCWAGLDEEAAQEFTTEEECKNIFKRSITCIVNALDACGVHPRLRAALIIFYDRYVYNLDCLAEIAN